MGTPYEPDRYVAILTRVRAFFDILFGLAIWAILVWALSGWRPSTSRSSRDVANERSAQVRPAEQRTDETGRRAARRERRNRSLDRLQNDPGRLAYGFTAGAFFIGLSVFEFILARSLQRGERRGFISGAAVESIGAVLGLLSFISRPTAGIGVVLSLLIFIYCIARLSGAGPKPA